MTKMVNLVFDWKPNGQNLEFPIDLANNAYKLSTKVVISPNYLLKFKIEPIKNQKEKITFTITASEGYQSQNVPEVLDFSKKDFYFICFNKFTPEKSVKITIDNIKSSLTKPDSEIENDPSYYHVQKSSNTPNEVPNAQIPKNPEVLKNSATNYKNQYPYPNATNKPPESNTSVNYTSYYPNSTNETDKFTKSNPISEESKPEATQKTKETNSSFYGQSKLTDSTQRSNFSESNSNSTEKTTKPKPPEQPKSSSTSKTSNTKELTPTSFGSSWGTGQTKPNQSKMVPNSTPSTTYEENPEIQRKLLAQYNKKPDLKNNKYPGLENQGQTCYINAFIQILYHSLPFSSGIDDLKCRDKIIVSLRSLFKEMDETKVGYVSTTDLTKKFGWTDEFVTQQHDATEFLGILFNKINLCLKNTDEKDFLKNIFGFQTEQTTKKTKEQSIAIIDNEKLDVPLMATIEESIAQTSKPDVFESEEGKVTKVTKIKTFPKVLLI
ncbi:Clan CA, family C19, ubiquitin hydrolase-like cysteine peptidase [Trichomonas vaginalis G3]|uniref:Clan CA, family C19, ubiquitin hydrolase-like cysteine peptidase n=1 Tax=Trichomonas vaginalis (strain ATCC PRA-98 / G3) TaxID=412133 RepID=A2F9N6_TRIV3|nr:thiol-dependent ubiquitin-specific protease protein [Trichomonas vaginalis G3]EAX98366.1 Clan CA, family C19, ubiquitin hydrolase-like cysteine peptidase [Trichomonas vaginalis G3]KAI5536664.1 thiol-dependent ubiquitin-specific protease protein [Trichomonas vaginalis G3]|eukprot:XP_001311296.1 Clan CA, family C19, ubiquitin hydrolase-like cysteine peptidase [Trichomonas vaginalis G3]